MPFFGGGSAYKIIGTNIKGGTDAAPAVIGSNNMALGNASLQNITSGDFNISIGNNALVSLTTGSNNIGIGYNSGPVSNGDNCIVIGNNASDGISASTSVIIGNNTSQDFFSANAGVFIGNGVIVGADNTVGIGANCDTDSFSVSIGALASASLSSIAVGYNALSTSGVSVGFLAESGNSSIAIGNGAIAGLNSILIADDQDISGVSNRIVIGDGSHTALTIGGKDFSLMLNATPTITGSRGGNAALASLLTGLAGLGLIVDNTTA